MELIIIAGPNGSGKSTLTDEGQLKEYGISFPQEHYINPDLIAHALRKANPERTIDAIQEEAFRTARAQRQKYREQGVTYAVETVFSHPSTILDMIRARAAGYRITFVFVATERAEINVARVAGRVLQGGHDVDENKIRSRYERSFRYLPRAVEEADVALVFDATEEGRNQLCFQKRNFVMIRDLPEFLEQRLISILKVRNEERIEIRGRFSELLLPDESAGLYAGPIRCVCSQFVVQELTDGTYVQHDLLVLDREQTPGNILSENEEAAISYRDGVWIANTPCP